MSGASPNLQERFRAISEPKRTGCNAGAARSTPADLGSHDGRRARAKSDGELPVFSLDAL
jgi:hypothetical protein